MKGVFIVFEGIDKSGKSTQASLLFSRLKENNIAVVLKKFPDRSTPIGHLIDNYLSRNLKINNESIHLLFSANRWEAIPEIENLLDSGVVIIADRYSFSGVVYSTCALGLDEEWCMNSDRGILSPNLVFYMDIHSSKAKLRLDYGSEIYEKEDIQQHVYNAFNKFNNEPHWIKLDAMKPKDELHEYIYKKTCEILENNTKNEINCSGKKCLFLK